MDKSIVKRILKLNEDFYQLHGDSFSESREKPWRGWNRILARINTLKKENIKILDLGSGNGRFYGYLKKNLKRDFEYLGVDQSDLLMKIAHDRYSVNGNFYQQKTDVITGLSKIKGLYDVVAAFGLTHHIPSRSLRRSWFKKTGNLVGRGGLLILTFWNVERILGYEAAGITKNKLDQGDFFLGWKKIDRAVRFMHLYSDSEINDVFDRNIPNKLQIIERFYSDKSKKSYNFYLVFKKS